MTTGTQPLYEKWFWGLMGLSALLLFVHIGAAPIYILDEAKNAQCAREMWLAGDWIVPTFNQQLRTDKPALHYWFMGLSYSLLGSGAAQARLFSGICGLGVLWVSFSAVRRYAGAGAGFFTALVLALSPHFLFEFRLSVPDPYLIFFTTAGLFAGFEYLFKGSRGALMRCACWLGVAVLAKGPVALVLPGLCFLVFVLLFKKWQVFKDPALLAALVAALGIAFPWYYAVHVKTGGAFTRGFFLEHNLNRFSAEKEGHGGPFIITPLIVILGLLPFSVLLFAALRRRAGYFRQPLFAFAAIVTGVYVVFFSISSTKLPNYPMPCYPFAAVLAGYLLKDVYEKRAALPVFAWWIWLPVAVALPVAAYFAIGGEPAVAGLSWIAILLVPVAIFTLLAFVSRNNPPLSLRWLGAGWVLFAMALLWVGYPLLYRQNPVTKLLPVVSGNGAQIVYYKAYNPGFNFNLPQSRMTIKGWDNMDSLEAGIRTLTAANRQQDIYIITRLDHAPAFEGRPFREIARERDLFELPTTVIFKWQQ